MRARLILSIFSLFIAACGAGGSGSSSSSAAQTAEGLTDKLWVLPLSVAASEECAVAAKFSSSGQFGFAYICESGFNVYKYEAIYGSYTVSGDKLILNPAPDNCSAYDSIFWDPKSPNNKQELVFQLSGNSLSLSDEDVTLNLVQFHESIRSDVPFVASRSCYAKQISGAYSWVQYSSSTTNESVEQQINNFTQPKGQSVASSFGASGSLSISSATGWVYGNLSATSSASLPGGPTYAKTNIAGDQIVLTIAGAAPNVTGYAAVYLTQASMSYFQMYCGGAPTMVSFNGTTLVAGNPGTLNIGVSVRSANGCQLNF